MTNSFIVELLAPDSSVLSVKQFASIKDFIRAYPDFKYHQVRKIYLHLKNNNVNQTKFIFTYYHLATGHIVHFSKILNK